MNQSLSDSDIKGSYGIVERNAKLVSALAVLLFAPRLILAFTSLDTFLGMYWKCPACKSFPGNGWSRVKCKKSGVELR